MIGCLPISTPPRAWSVSVIVPVYNEADLIVDSLRTIGEFLGAHFADYEILVVESGSTDGSDRACDAIADIQPRMRVVHEGSRRGYGSAVRQGWSEARLDLVWVITPDLPFPLEVVLQALPLLDSHDCVLSFRSVDRRGPPRRLQSAVYNATLRLVLGLRVQHVNSAFKLVRREVVQQLSLVSNGWFIDAELIYRLQEAAIPTALLGVPLIDRSVGRSSVGFRTWVGVLRELWLFLRVRDKVANRLPG